VGKSLWLEAVNRKVGPKKDNYHPVVEKRSKAKRYQKKVTQVDLKSRMDPNLILESIRLVKKVRAQSLLP